MRVRRQNSIGLAPLQEMGYKWNSYRKNGGNVSCQTRMFDALTLLGLARRRTERLRPERRQPVYVLAE